MLMSGEGLMQIQQGNSVELKLKDRTYVFSKVTIHVGLMNLFQTLIDSFGASARSGELLKSSPGLEFNNMAMPNPKSARSTIALPTVKKRNE